MDRSAAYAARYVAKNIVAAGLADKCEIQLSYAIGVAQPTSVMVDTFGTGKVADEKLVDIVRENFDLRPAGIIKMRRLPPCPPWCSPYRRKHRRHDAHIRHMYLQ